MARGGVGEISGGEISGGSMWQPLSDRLLYARLAHKHCHVSIIVAYAPTNEASDSDKDCVYDELNATTQTIPPHNELLVIGDLNAVSGEAKIGFETVVRPHKSGSANDNTERLHSFCASFGLAITGSSVLIFTVMRGSPTTAGQGKSLIMSLLGTVPS